MKRKYFHNFTNLHELKQTGNPQNKNRNMQVSFGGIKMNYFGMKKIIYFTLYIVLGVLFNSCEKSLDLVSQTAYTEATFFKTADQFKLFTNQFYLNLPVVGYSTDRDLASDLLVAPTMSSISDGSYSAGPSSAIWQNAYSTIRNTTYLIQKVDEVSPDLKAAVTVYSGEGKFFRALAYFDLFNNYGGVPIIDKVLDLNDDLLHGSRNSREEVFDYIMNDLDDAINILPVESDIATNDKGRVSKGAVLALKARVALFEGTWRKFRGIAGYETILDKAIDASDQVISGGQYELFDRRDVLGDESYRYFFILDKKQSNIANLTKTNQKEYILANRYDEVIRPQPTTSFINIVNPTRKFADMFLCKDGLPVDRSPLFQGRLTITSEYENRDLRMKNIFIIPGTQIWESSPIYHVRDWSKPFDGGYPDVPAGSNVVVFGQFTITGYMEHKFGPEIYNPNMDFPVIRYAEVILINAEALYERNGSITDAQLDLTINNLRARAEVAKLSNAFVSSNGLDMRTEIRRERTIELFKEGHRFDDLRRWKTAETEMPQALKGVLWTGTQYATDPQYNGVVYPLDADGSIIVQDASIRRFEEKHYLFPLPTIQILLNPKLEQNPGW